MRYLPGPPRFQMQVHSRAWSDRKDFYSRGRLRFRHQGRPVSDYLFNLRSPAPQSANRGRPVQPQRSELFREALDRCLIAGADRDSKKNFCDVTRGLSRQIFMQRARADKLRKHRVKFQSERIKAASKNKVGCFRLFVCVRPRIDQRADGFIASRIAY